MVTEPTARQRPQPVTAILAATAGLALALFGSAPAAAEPPGVPAGAPTQGAQRHDQSYPSVPSWLDPAREPALRAEAEPRAVKPRAMQSRAADPLADPTPPPVEEPTTPAEEPTAPVAEPTPPVAEPTRPAADPAPPKPSPTHPDRTENEGANPDPPAAAHGPAAAHDPPAAYGRPVVEEPAPQSGQGGELAARPIAELPDTRGLDERVPTVLPSPSPDAQPAAATRLASGAAGDRTDGFARSLIYSGLIGLAIALYGLSMVGRRRRTW